LTAKVACRIGPGFGIGTKNVGAGQIDFHGETIPRAASLIWSGHSQQAQSDSGELLVF
jgi:hypothetical protein